MNTKTQPDGLAVLEATSRARRTLDDPTARVSRDLDGSVHIRDLFGGITFEGSHLPMGQSMSVTSPFRTVALPSTVARQFADRVKELGEKALASARAEFDTTIGSISAHIDTILKDPKARIGRGTSDNRGYVEIPGNSHPTVAYVNARRAPDGKGDIIYSLVNGVSMELTAGRNLKTGNSELVARFSRYDTALSTSFDTELRGEAAEGIFNQVKAFYGTHPKIGTSLERPR